jgi:hypothetical protein
VEAGVPAVVAMQDQVTVRAARQLASDFWRDLLAHGEVDRALNAGRLLLVDDEGTDWSTPVLFMRLRDGRLFEPQPSPITTSTPVPASLPLSQQQEARGQDEADAPGGRSLRSIWTNLPGIAKSVIGLLTVLIPLATAWVQAGIPPFAPGPTPTVAASTLAATLMDVQLGARNVQRRQVYQEHPGLDPANDDVSPEELDQRGQLVSYRIEFQGLLDRRCVVKWTLYDGTTGERVPDGTWITNHAMGWPDGTWIVEARERDVGQGEVWVPHVAPGQFVVELEVYDDRGVLLDTERPTDARGQPESFSVG